MKITFTDRCNAPEDRKPDTVTIEVPTGPIVVGGDTMTIDGRPFYRVEPVGFGDVHWEVGDTKLRYTHIEVQP